MVELFAISSAVKQVYRLLAASLAAVSSQVAEQRTSQCAVQLFCSMGVRPSLL